nr:hypothetical protein [uncultured Mucilaginibacter sp.]
MKKYLIILLVLTGALRVSAQNKLTAEKKDSLVNASLEEASAVIEKGRAQDDKLNFAKRISALGSFVSSESDALTFKATIFGLRTAIRPSLNVDSIYRNHVFQRNFEIDLSATPNESVFKYSGVTAGFTYAILNNVSVKKSDYERLSQSYDVEDQGLGYNKLLTVLAALKISHPEWRETIDKLLTSELPEKVFIPKELGKALKKEGFINGAEVFKAADKQFADLKEEVKTRPLLTIGPNVNYDGERGWAKKVSIKGGLTLYSLLNKNRKIAWSLTPSYSLSTDTAMQTAKLSRKIFNTDLSANIIIPDENGKSVFEIKPILSYTNTKGGLYKDEKENAWSFATKLTFRINDDFSLPITFKVTQNKPNFLSFLSVQYSL